LGSFSASAHRPSSSKSLKDNDLDHSIFGFD
jgi:hypothetical protein